MPVYLTLSSLIIEKKIVAKKCKGGIEQFRNEYFNRQGEASQEDDEVFLIARMNYDEYDFEKLISMGLEYDETKEYSNDFVIHQRYHGYLWQVDWIEDNDFYAWHEKTDEQLKNRAKAFGNITGNELEELYKNGQNPFVPLTMKNINTHPISRQLDKSNNSNNEQLTPDETPADNSKA